MKTVYQYTLEVENHHAERRDKPTVHELLTSHSVMANGTLLLFRGSVSPVAGYAQGEWTTFKVRNHI